MAFNTVAQNKEVAAAMAAAENQEAMQEAMQRTQMVADIDRANTGQVYSNVHGSGKLPISAEPSGASGAVLVQRDAAIGPLLSLLQKTGATSVYPATKAEMEKLRANGGRSLAEIVATMTKGDPKELILLPVFDRCRDPVYAELLAANLAWYTQDVVAADPRCPVGLQLTTSSEKELSARTRPQLTGLSFVLAARQAKFTSLICATASFVTAQLVEPGPYPTLDELVALRLGLMRHIAAVAPGVLDQFMLILESGAAYPQKEWEFSSSLGIGFICTTPIPGGVTAAQVRDTTPVDLRTTPAMVAMQHGGMVLFAQKENVVFDSSSGHGHLFFTLTITRNRRVTPHTSTLKVVGTAYGALSSLADVERANAKIIAAADADAGAAAK